LFFFCVDHSSESWFSFLSGWNLFNKKKDPKEETDEFEEVKDLCRIPSTAATLQDNNSEYRFFILSFTLYFLPFFTCMFS
jgi:hypothetical protein